MDAEIAIPLWVLLEIIIPVFAFVSVFLLGCPYYAYLFYREEHRRCLELEKQLYELWECGDI